MLLSDASDQHRSAFLHCVEIHMEIHPEHLYCPDSLYELSDASLRAKNSASMQDSIRAISDRHVASAEIEECIRRNIF